MRGCVGCSRTVDMLLLYGEVIVDITVDVVGLALERAIRVASSGFGGRWSGSKSFVNWV